MTTSMIITLAIVVLMVVVIISDKLPFGAPALIAAALLVVFNQADVATAFCGFTDKNVIMIMGFFACMAALQKTKLIYDPKRFLGKVASKGGILGFALLILAIMAIGNFISGTAYYVLVITIISSIPYNKALPTSRMLLPATWASTYSGWLPNSNVFFLGLASSLIAVPGLKDGIAPLRLFFKADCTAGKVDQYYLFTSIVKCLDNAALNGGKCDCRSVASSETGHGNRHLLSLQLGRYATGKNHHVYAVKDPAFQF